MDSGAPILSKETENIELDALATACTDSIPLGRSAEPPLNGHTRAPRKSKNSNKHKNENQEEGIIGSLCAWVVDHQIGISVNLLLLLALTHMCFPRARQQTRKFFTLSHYNPETGRYAIGGDDFWAVCYSIVILTGLRVAVMDYLLAPLAQYGSVSRKDIIRFAEQGWLCVYCPVSFSWGMYIMYHSDYWFNFRELWTNWPDREMDGLSKWYYIVQFSFWVQQILVVNIEARRKDYAQMFTHHIVTCALMFTSYGYHYTKVGNVILCIMDCTDIILSSAKCLKYMKFQVACDVAFGLFLVQWLSSRHGIYGMILYSIYKDYPEVTQFGCFRGSNTNLEGPFEVEGWFMKYLTPFRDPQGIVCQDRMTTASFVFLLLSLQAILLVWFVMIVRVAVKVIRGDAADDIRSDDEGDFEDEIDDMIHEMPSKQNGFIEVPPLEEDVGVEGINLSGRKSSPAKVFRRGHSAASGVSLPSDKKELLGRIGCDKGA